MSKYSILLNVLDHIRAEAHSTRFSSRYPSSTDPEQVNQQRALAFIHLFLKVRFGLLHFEEREHFITDGPGDGGIDGYYPDIEHRTIYFLQSKFRCTEANFANKQMSLEELLAMDVMRILEGHQEDENGDKYNGKILQLQREVSSISDIARYQYEVVLLANVDVSCPQKLSRVVGGLPCEVIDHEKCYQTLVFPVISGSYFNAENLVIHLDLSNKNAGSKISYAVDTRFGSCEITALFVPTLEIAKTFHKYKNSILRFNPRSYLELEGARVNEAIRNTIIQQGKNEFALYNNGITMLSDETNLNEKIGQRNKAKLNVKNPQIINGGQTAYTLSRIYEENTPESAEKLFDGKEVLLKVITLSSGVDTREKEKLDLIEAISEATNLQTPVITADRFSNEPVNLQLQKLVFDRYGLLFERKRGEFEDGVRNGYVHRSQIVERNRFFRILFAANGDLNRAVQKRLFAKLSKSGWSIPTSDQLDKFYFAYLCYQALDPKPGVESRGAKEIYAKVYVMTAWYIPLKVGDFRAAVQRSIDSFKAEWKRFLELYESKNARFVKTRVDRKTGAQVAVFNKERWVRSGLFGRDVQEYFARVLSHSAQAEETGTANAQA
jgi:AIPR protein